MHLIIVRHAQALSKQEDPSRPLNEKGKIEAEKLNAFLKTQDLAISRVFHSSKARAKETAEIVAQDLNSVDTLESLGALDPEEDIQKLAQIIDYFTEDTVLVGHIPHVELLSNFLLSGDFVRPVSAFETASAMCFQKAQNKWVLKWFISPQLL